MTVDADTLRFLSFVIDDDIIRNVRLAGPSV